MLKSDWFHMTLIFSLWVAERATPNTPPIGQFWMGHVHIQASLEHTAWFSGPPVAKLVSTPINLKFVSPSLRKRR